MYKLSKMLKLLADPQILKAVGDTSSIIDGYLELDSDERRAIVRDLSERAKVLIAKAKQNGTTEQEDSDNGDKH